MVVYLLEKSRLTYQQPLERCYHSFYNLMSDAVPDLKEKCLLSNDIRDYHYVSQGELVTMNAHHDKSKLNHFQERSPCPALMTRRTCSLLTRPMTSWDSPRRRNTMFTR